MVEVILAAITATVLLASSAAPSSAQYRYRGGYGYGGGWHGGGWYGGNGAALGLGFLGGASATAPYYAAPYYGAPGYGYAPAPAAPPLGTSVIHYSNITRTYQTARLHGGK